MNECQFDLQTVTNFDANFSSLDDTNKHFSVFLKQERQRVESGFDQQFMKLVD